MNAAQERSRSALERLAKWRALFAGWQLGTVDSDGNPWGGALTAAALRVRRIGSVSIEPLPVPGFHAQEAS